jgi:hypothetical protein
VLEFEEEPLPDELLLVFELELLTFEPDEELLVFEPLWFVVE